MVRTNNPEKASYPRLELSPDWSRKPPEELETQDIEKLEEWLTRRLHWMALRAAMTCLRTSIRSRESRIEAVREEALLGYTQWAGKLDYYKSTKKGRVDGVTIRAKRVEELMQDHAIPFGKKTINWCCDKYPTLVDSPDYAAHINAKEYLVVANVTISSAREEVQFQLVNNILYCEKSQTLILPTLNFAHEVNKEGLPNFQLFMQAIAVQSYERNNESFSVENIHVNLQNFKPFGSGGEYGVLVYNASHNVKDGSVVYRVVNVHQLNQGVIRGQIMPDIKQILNSASNKVGIDTHVVLPRSSEWQGNSQGSRQLRLL